MMRNDDHVFNGAIPAEIAENLNEFFPEFGDLNDEEVLQHQESVYQSLKGNGINKESRSYYGQSSESQISGQELESSRRESFDSLLALDEALARSLQELEDNIDDFNISQSSSTSTENTELSSRETPAAVSMNQNTREDDIDPDDMTYEQLQLLGDSVGSANKGLSKELISSLRNYKYKTGILSKKKDKQECVICLTMFKNGDKLISLPCAHQYHSKCISRWLELNKGMEDDLVMEDDL